MGDQGSPSRCIECEEIRLAQVYDQRPVQTLPFPRAALAGLPEGRTPRDLSRRRLLQGGLAGFASVYGAHALGWDSIWESAVAEAAEVADKSQNVLVLLYLAGGNDGLNTIVPTGTSDYAAYQGFRPVIGRKLGATTFNTDGTVKTVGSQYVPGTGNELSFSNPVVSTAGGGDNGSSVGFDTLYNAGNLALMPSTDYTPANLSHFTSADYWFAGATSELTTGWLGRWLDNNGSSTNPLQAISLNTSISKAIRTASAPVCSIPQLSGLGFSFQADNASPGIDWANYVDANAQLQTLSGVQASAGNTALARSRSGFSQAVQVYNAASGLALESTTAPYPANSYLATQLQLASTLISAGLGTRVITLNWGGFDSHGGQISLQDPLLKELSQCLGAFQADLVSNGTAANVSTLVFSEFGRRVTENGSAGTDHGAGGLMMAMGSKVNGGWAAPFSGLSSLDSDGDLAVATDFRSVYQAVIDEWLGGDSTDVLPGAPSGGFAPLQRYDSGTALFSS